MRRFWFFTSDDGGRPHFPVGVVPRKASYVCPFTLLGETAGHAHLKIGSHARPDARLSGDGALHFHDLIQHAGTWYTFTEGAANHEHTVPDSPSWQLMCATLRDEDVAACTADPQMFNVGEIVEGELSTEQWSGTEQTTWTNRMRAGLYLNLPAIINSNLRFVKWLLGIAGLEGSERGYRCPE
ncbi:MAG: hypothetical protein GF347_00600 [Candidatus Moranbacteria bacterium]|nr:hypothetical protein [Candidatus Moranbacteria bacterium]